MKYLTGLLVRTKKMTLPGVCKRCLAAATLLLGLTTGQFAGAAGLLSPNNGSPALKLAEQHVSVIIENGYAVTEVDQTFSNPHSQDLTAIYSFPVPEEAAVGEFTFWIDGTPVHAEVLEKQAARKIHDQQVQQGNESALVEQDGYRTFDAEVSPVRAGQDVRIRLVYLQRSAIDHAMGRYVYPLEEGGVDEVKEQFWSRNETVSDAFSFKLRLRSAYPVDAMRVTNGQAAITQLDSGEWELLIDSRTGDGTQTGTGLSDQEVSARLLADDIVPLENAGRATDYAESYGSETAHSKAAYSLNRDIVVYWRLAENLPGAVDLVTYKEPDATTGTFMLTLTPGIDLAPITEGRDWLFVLDTSGSMQGKFTTLVDAVQRSLTSLKPADRFKVILFSDRAKSLSDNFQTVSADAVQRTLKQLDHISAGGGTNLFDGLHAAVKSLDQDRTTAIVLATDGVANVGQTEMKQFLKLIDKVDVRLFTAVMGNSANRPLLEGLTKHSEGFAINVSNDDDMVGLMLQVTSKVTHEALHNVDLSIDGIRTRDLTPDKFSRIYRGEQLIIMGKYSGAGVANVTLNADISGETKHYVSQLVFPENSISNPELERLWAFASIKSLQDQQDLLGVTEDSKQGITDLALQHGLVTDYTSLLVVREEVFQSEGIERNNAKRVERERAARTVRAAESITQTRQDSSAPMFSESRQSTSNSGGGSMGLWFLALLSTLAILRIGLGLFDSYRERAAEQAAERKAI
ncbi:VIT domain-containing protein [Granulosicoccus antarcticus]|uniref:Uncharacterized protein n=1 Tax=Granulosicoccus antarcticus IMCC3135 TaxID=1192854 RepID=A0A2Z2NU72_9GAMM|nr:VIT domain-containing protein [Granulosicoccus antarcticus]ASJ74803.1 hypothetical protein IMCC3135_23670 [Granulosicoccus antarcticus IMCC3135]